MKQTNLSIFIPHIGCPHLCSFCDQKSISGAAKAPSAEEVRELLARQAEHLTTIGAKAEIAFFGGSFTAIPRGYMTELLETAARAVRVYDAYNGIRCSTRPDCVSDEITHILREYGVTSVELGAQSMSDEVLAANDRGHTADDVRQASELIKKSGIRLGLQMMTGLYRDSRGAVLDTAREFIKIAPETVRIYPTVILKGTRLGELYERGEYTGFGFDETVELCAELLRMFGRENIAVIRMGLHASAEVERDRLGGVYHPAFRELCESRIMLKDITACLEKLPKGEYTVLTDKRNISRLVGQRRGNIAALEQAGYKIKVGERTGAYLEIIPKTEI